MSRKKGLHIFEVGELVLPHPVIYLHFNEAEKGDIGIITKIVPPEKHDSPRLVQVYWQIKCMEGLFNSELVFHLHHEEIVELKNKEWEEEKNALRNRSNFSFKPQHFKGVSYHNPHKLKKNT